MGQRILVFESDANFATELEQNFGRLGFEVDVVADGNDGLALAAERRPDLILLTIELPSINGFAVCKKIKKSQQFRDIPLVILSADPHAEENFEQHRKLRTRAEDYLRKPLTFDTLFERLSPYLVVDARGGAHVDAPGGAHVDARGGAHVDARGGADSGELAVIHIDSDDSGVQELSGEDFDDAIDAFTETAFDSLVMEEETLIGTLPAHLHLEKEHSQGAVREHTAEYASGLSSGGGEGDPVELDDLISLEEVHEPPSTDRPPVSVDQAEGAMRKHTAQLEEEIARLRKHAAEADSLRKELADLRGRASKGSGVSSREFLDLRESLNRKDREILDLKDQLSARDKQVLELRDGTLKLERDKADIGDKLLQVERDLDDARRTTETLQADKDAAAKRFEDIKQRLERAEAKGKKLEDELQAAQQAHIQESEELRHQRERDLEQMQQRYEEQLARRAAEEAAAVERLQLESQRSLAEAKEALVHRTEELRSQHAAEVARLTEQYETSVTRLQQEHQEALRGLREQHAGEVGALEAAHAEESARRAAELERKREDALIELRQRLESDAAEQLATAERRWQEEVATAAVQHDQALRLREEQLREEQEVARRQMQESHSRELALVGRKLSENEGALLETQGRLEALGAEKAGVDRELERVTAERDTLGVELNSARASIEELQALSTEREERIGKLETTEGALREEVAQLKARKVSDDQILERARKAMAIGLGLLDERQRNWGE